jgi:hypothetical protein
MQNGSHELPAIGEPTLRNSQAIGITLAALAPLPVLLGQWAGTGLNPLTSPISQYVHLPGGYQLVLLGSLLLAGCGAMIGLDLLRRPRTSRDRSDLHRLLAAALLLSFAAALTVVGLVPTDPHGSPTLSAMELVHRTCVIWSFVALPAAGFVLARSRRLVEAKSGLALFRLGIGLLVGVLIFGAIQLPLLIAGSGIPALGLVERLAFAFMIIYLILLTKSLRSAGSRITANKAPSGA